MIAIKCRKILHYSEETQLGIIIDMIGITLKYAAVMVCWYSSAIYHQTKVNSIFNHLKLIENNKTTLTLKSRRNEIENTFKKFSHNLIIINVLSLVILTLNNLISTFYKNCTTGHTSMIFNTFQIVIYNVIFIFLSIVSYLKENYSQINKVLNKCTNEYKNNTQVIHDTMLSLKKLQSVGFTHKNITDLLEIIMEFFRLPLLLIITAIFLQILFYPIFYEDR